MCVTIANGKTFIDGCICRDIHHPRIDLSTKDIKKIWNNGVPFDVRQFTSFKVLRAYYRMGDNFSDSETYIKDTFDSEFYSPDFYGTPLGITAVDFVLDTP